MRLTTSKIDKVKKKPVNKYPCLRLVNLGEGDMFIALMKNEHQGCVVHTETRYWRLGEIYVPDRCNLEEEDYVGGVKLICE